MAVVTFRPLGVRSIVQGRGAMEQLPRVLEQFGVRRALLVTGRSLAEKTDVVERLRALLGERLAGVYAGISQHTPAGQVLAAAEQARSLQADGLISLGGGSPIDGTKAVAWALSREVTSREQLLGRAPAGRAGPVPPHVMLPTTLSAAECSFGAGFTDEETRTKTGVADPELAATAVVYDPELTVHTPGWLWAATGMRAIDHAVESLYSPDQQPLTDTLALEALRLLWAYLPATSGGVGERGSGGAGEDSRAGERASGRAGDSDEGRGDAETRGRGESETNDPLEQRLLCQQASWFSFYGTSSLRMGPSHALGRRIGARFDVPHGHTSALTLPPVMRSKVDQVPDRLRLVARAVGVDSPELSDRQAAERACEAVQQMVIRLELPTRLSEVGITEDDLAWIAEDRPETVELLRSIL